MDLSTITVTDFKALFRRDFPYLPVFSDTARYNEGAIVFYSPTELLYMCLVNGTKGVPPIVTTAWDITDGDIDDFVLDADIEAAQSKARLTINQNLFSSDDGIKLAFLYLSAHYLANDMRTALAGGIGGQATMPLTGKSVGNVRETYGIPEAYLKEAMFASYATTPYGLQYLALVLPLLRGNIGAVLGATTP